jgi:hypothetical protein
MKIKGQQNKIYWLNATCLFLAIAFLFCIFLPIIKHFKAEEPSLGLGNYTGNDIISGGLYDIKKDTIGEDNLYVKYEKMTSKAQEYYVTFIAVQQGNLGSISALFLLITQIFAALLAASWLFPVLTQKDTTIICAIISAVTTVLTIVTAFLFASLTNYTKIEGRPLLSFEVNISWGMILMLVFSILLSIASFYALAKKVKRC